MISCRGDQGETRAAAVAERLHLAPPHEILDATPAFEKLLVEYDSQAAYECHIPALIEWMKSADFSHDPASRSHIIPVLYNGEDLQSAAEQVGMHVDDFIALHQAPTYRVALIGFSPGFPYLSGLDSRLHTPRRAVPRPIISAGAVGIGGSLTGIYSLPTPGGWNLIGTTCTRLFDLSRYTSPGSAESAFLLRAGDSVKFVAQ
jgi:KipI family sensor histidine kinase inhibitor